MSAVEEKVELGVAVVESDPGRRLGLTSQLGGRTSIASFGSLSSLQEALEFDSAIVVVLGPSCSQPEQLVRAEWLTRMWPGLGLILVVDTLTTELLQQAMRAGIKDVLASPDPTQLTWAVERLNEGINVATGRPVALAPSISDTPGKLTTVFSPKGGSGTSVIAGNLAVALAQRSSGMVALVDADLQFGDIAVMLKTKLEHTIVDAAAAGDRLDSLLLQSLMFRHEPSGLMVLPAPIEPALAEKVGIDDVRHIIEVLRSFCDHVVVDTPSTLNELVLTLVDESDDIVLVSAMEVPSVKNMKLGVQTLRLLETPSSKFKLVLVRPHVKVQMEVGDVERALSLEASIVVPNDAAVPVSLNKCVPVVIDAPRSPASKSIEGLADLFMPAASHSRRRRRS